MSLLGTIVLVGSIPAIVLMFMWLPAPRAAVISAVGGYLFLPPGAIAGFGLVPVTKETCLSLGLILGMLVGGAPQLRALRFSRWDLFIVAWCLVPVASSLSNDLGPYDGLASAATAILIYGVPYLVGRALFSDSRAIAMLGLAVVVGGLIYVPFCWFEMRMSPKLNAMIYGFGTQGVTEARRLGGWRPSVFLQHGLAAGMWMAIATLIALGLWRTGRLPRIAGLPPGLCVGLLGVTAVGCASTGAIALLALGIVVVMVSGWTRSLTPLMALVLVSPAYLIARVAFDWKPDALVEVVADFDAERAGSLQIRVESDSAFRDHAMARPWFGWGGWGRGTSVAYAPDSFFGIAISKHGVVGLVGAFGAMIAAQWLSMRRVRAPSRSPAAVAVVTPLVCALAVYTLDCLLNGMLSPVFTLTSGALVGWGVGGAQEALRPPSSTGRGLRVPPAGGRLR